MNTAKPAKKTLFLAKVAWHEAATMASYPRLVEGKQAATML